MPKVKQNVLNTLYNFTVTGTHEFPWDMLRYDRCWPHHETTITEMAPYHRSSRYNEMRTVMLQGLREPTEARWSSFGWKILDVEIIRVG